MPQSPERKREYMRTYMAKRRTRGTRLGFAKVSPQRGDTGKGRGEIQRGGVSPLLVPQIRNKEMLVPTRERENVSPCPIPMNPRTMSKRKLVEYLAYVGQRGFCLSQTGQDYFLVAVWTGEMVPFDSVEIIERRLTEQGQRIAQLEMELARQEVMLDSMLTETWRE